jgi:hypothetical protein
MPKKYVRRTACSEGAFETERQIARQASSITELQVELHTWSSDQVVLSVPAEILASDGQEGAFLALPPSAKGRKEPPEIAIDFQ